MPGERGQGPWAAFKGGEDRRGAGLQAGGSFFSSPTAAAGRAWPSPSSPVDATGLLGLVYLQSSFQFVYWQWQKPIFTSVSRVDVAGNEQAALPPALSAKLPAKHWLLDPFVADARHWCIEQSSKTSCLFTFCYAGGEKNVILTTELSECINRECMCTQMGIWPQHIISWKCISDHNWPKILVVSSYFASAHPFSENLTRCRWLW